ncbi:hypothetical protein C1646_767845 [Rhizophagus diaphanus]|nr:hypothetical protein C1646_767845 [Rhizophagus diaphanus] [Rhizophagus sp. MUCL 43196]
MSNYELNSTEIAYFNAKYHQFNNNMILKEKYLYDVFHKNQFKVAFSIAKTAINIALKTKIDKKLIKILEDFIAIKYEKQSERNNHTNNNLRMNNYTED